MLQVIAGFLQVLASRWGQLTTHYLPYEPGHDRYGFFQYARGFEVLNQAAMPKQTAQLAIFVSPEYHQKEVLQYIKETRPKAAIMIVHNADRMVKDDLKQHPQSVGQRLSSFHQSSLVGALAPHAKKMVEQLAQSSGLQAFWWLAVMPYQHKALVSERTRSWNVAYTQQFHNSTLSFSADQLVESQICMTRGPVLRYSCLRGFALQGNLQDSRRDYEGLWADVLGLLRYKAKARQTFSLDANPSIGNGSNGSLAGSSTHSQGHDSQAGAGNAVRPAARALARYAATAAHRLRFGGRKLLADQPKPKTRSQGSGDVRAESMEVYVLGGGSAEDIKAFKDQVPPELRRLVHLKAGLKFPAYYDTIQRSHALLTQFGSAAYTTTKISSTVITSLITCTPMILPRKAMEAYTFLSEDVVYVQVRLYVYAELTKCFSTYAYLNIQIQAPLYAKPQSS